MAEPIAVAPVPALSETYRRPAVTILAAFAFAGAAALLYYLTVRSNDFIDYQGLWYRAQNQPFVALLLTERPEIGSLFIFWALAHVAPASVTIYAFGFTALSIKSYLIQRYLNQPWLAWLCYLVVFLYLTDATQIRSAIGACFVLYALVSTHRFRVTVAVAVVGALFHNSALVILALWFVPRPLIGLIGIGVIAASWNVLLTLYPTEFGLRYLSYGTGSVNLTNSNFIAQAFMCAVAAYEWPRLTETQKKGAYLMMIGVVMYVSFLQNAIVAHRFRELSMLGFLPLIFSGERRISDTKLLWLAGVAYLAAYNVWFLLGKYGGL